MTLHSFAYARPWRCVAMLAVVLWPLATFAQGPVRTQPVQPQNPQQEQWQREQQRRMQEEQQRQQLAQQQTEKVDAEGAIESIEGDMIRFKADKDTIWIVEAPRGKATISVEGPAEVGFLQAGQTVRITTDIDEKGAFVKPIDHIEVFTPTGRIVLGLFKPGGESQGDRKPERKIEAGAYDIVAKVASFKDGKLSLTAGGHKLSGAIDAAAKIDVKLTDLGYAQAGDSVKVVGWRYRYSAPDASKNKPGQAVADEVTVTLVQPLTSNKKSKPSKTSRAAKTKSADNTIDVNDPFGAKKK